MPKKVLKSWTTGADGSLIENDYKIYVDEEDYTYEIEVTTQTLGVALGVDPSSRKYTAITRIPDKNRMEKFLNIVHIGDILLEINDEIVLDKIFDANIQSLEALVAKNETRKVKFLNKKKCSIEKYRQKLRLIQPSVVVPPVSPTAKTDLSKLPKPENVDGNVTDTSDNEATNAAAINQSSGNDITGTPMKVKTITRDSLGFECNVEYHILEKLHHTQQHAGRMKRDLEWVDYLKAIGGAENLKPAGIFKPLKDLKQLVRKGIPVAYRSLIWQKISLSSIYRLQYPTNYYQSLLQRVPNELSAKIASDIEKDIDRTFPEHPFFQPSQPGEQVLRRILQAFAIHNPEIGYCQSLNFIVGMMIIFMTEEDAFWLFVTVIEKLLPSDYYTKTMVGTYVDQFVLSHIIKKYLPRIHSTLETNNLQLPLITVQWFMCLFVNTLRTEVTLRIWDIFFNEGNKVLFRVAAALFKINEAKLWDVTDAAELFHVLRVIGKDITDADTLITIAYPNYLSNIEVVKHPTNKKKSSSASSRRGDNNNNNNHHGGFFSRRGGNGNDRNSLQSVLNDGAWNTDTNHHDGRGESMASMCMSDSSSCSKLPPSLGGSPSTTPPSTSSFLLSPRLMIKNSLHYGYVPSPIVGIGHAHLGPRQPPTEAAVDLTVTATAAAAAAIIQEEEVKEEEAVIRSHSTATIPIDNSITAPEFTLSEVQEAVYQELVITAQEVSNELSHLETQQDEEEEERAEEDTEGKDIGKVVHEDKKEEDIPSTPPTIPVADISSPGSVRTTHHITPVSATTARASFTTTSGSNKHRDSIDPNDPIFTNPSLILNTIEDSSSSTSATSSSAAKRFSAGKPSSPSSASFSATGASNHSGNRPMKKTSGKTGNNANPNRKIKPGELHFSRNDIAIWRNSFRPGLQERYERMEKARVKWRADGSINKSSVLVTSSQLIASSVSSSSSSSTAPAPVEVPPSLHHPVSPSSSSLHRVVEEEEDIPLTPITNAILEQLQRASIDSTNSKNVSKSQVGYGTVSVNTGEIDVDAINTTYSLDHEIAMDAITPKKL